MRKLCLALCLLPLALPAGAVAFGTYDGLHGQSGEHGRITRAGQWCQSSAAEKRNCWHSKAVEDVAGPLSGKTPFSSNLGAVAIPDGTLFDIAANDDAHCDNLDYLIPSEDHAHVYTSDSLGQQRAKLLSCVNYLHDMFDTAVSTSLQIVDNQGFFRQQNIRRPGQPCKFSFTITSEPPVPANKRCAAVDFYGQALHGAEDFYSHTNWSDRAVAPFDAENPPGYGQDSLASFLNFRHVDDFLPRGAYPSPPFSGGCFVLGHQSECDGHVKHDTLAKDEGYVNPRTGEGTPTGDSNRRARENGNFGRAVSLAVKQVHDSWSAFQDRVKQVDEQDSKQIVCAMVQDDTIHDCTLKVELNIKQKIHTADHGHGFDACAGDYTFSNDDTSTLDSTASQDHGQPGYAELPLRNAQSSQPQPQNDEQAKDPNALVGNNGSGQFSASKEGCGGDGGGAGSGANPCPGHSFRVPMDYDLAVDKHRQVVVRGLGSGNCAGATTEIPLGVSAETMAGHELDGSQDTFNIDFHDIQPINTTVSGAGYYSTDTGQTETTITGTVTVTYGKGDKDS